MKHGMKKTRLYRIWQAMKTRCYNPNSERYSDYGGRGISVCDEWKNDFLAFYGWAMSHGYSDNLSIDRIENDKGYFPDNCRWADSDTQANNSRHNRQLEYKGEKHTLSEWCKRLNLSRSMVNDRINAYGWTVERAFETPKSKRGRKRCV